MDSFREYFLTDNPTYRITTCCQFHDSSLKKQANIGTCTKTNALKTPGKASAKAIDNCKQLITFMNIIKTWPINLRSFRISSTMFPCFTLPEIEEEYDYVLEELEQLLSIAGNIAKDNKIRLSMHPDQFCVLASNRQDVVENSIKEFEYHALIGEMLGLLPETFSVNVHLQGRYGAPTTEDGIKRFANNFKYLNEYSQRCLSVENEDKPNGYDIVDTLELAQRIPIRTTLDIHHYECYRKKQGDYITSNHEYFKEAVKTWKDFRPLFHVSHTKLDEEGNDVTRMNQHSDKLHDLERLSLLVPMLKYADFDIEAKHKEKAVKAVYKFIKEEEELAGEPILVKNPVV